MKRIFVALVLFVLTGPPAFADAVRVLPAVVPSGAEINIAGRGLAVGARYLISLEQGGTVENLGVVPVDGVGRFDETIGLPPLNPGEWQVRVSLTGTVVATAPLRILANPGIETNPGQGYPGETIEVQGFGLTPGADVEIRVDGLRLVGPVAVETPEDVFSFDVPASTSGVDESIGVVLTQSLEGLDAGEAPSAITRLAPQQTSFGNLLIQGVPANLTFSQTYSFTGSIQVPDGVNAPSLEWQYAVAVDGLCLPVPSAVVQMNPSGDFAVLNANVNALVDGIPARYLRETFDEHGLVYRNPDTGEQDCVTVGGLNLKMKDFVPLKIKVVDDSGNPIGGARVVFRQGFYRSPFEDLGEGRGAVRAPGGSDGINTTDAHLYGPNQFTQAEFEFQQDVQGLINGRCPATGILQYTEVVGPDAGTALFELNPFAYWAQYKGGYAASSVDINTRAPIPDPIEFSIKVAAVDLGYGYETVDGCATGVRFDVQPRNDGFYLRDPETNEFTIFYDPFGDPLEVFLPDLPQNADICFPADPYMPGLELEPVLPGEFQLDDTFAYLPEGFTRFRTVTSFPQSEVPESFFASVAPGELEIEYDQALFGQLEGLQLTLEDQAPIPMTFSALGGACDIDGGVISAAIPNLHRYSAGSYNGTIQGEIGTSGRVIREDVQIIVREGPTWFVDPTQYENVEIFWRQDEVDIRADEVMQMVDATPSDPEIVAELAEYDVSLEGNDQAASAMVEQEIRLGAFENRVRTSITDGQVNGRSEPQTPTVSDISEDDDSPRGGRTAPRGRSSSCAHADGPNGSPGTPFPRPDALTDFGSCEPETLFETGNIPVFRYAWGIPPIAAATLGADIWFGVYFRYFGDVALEMQKISVNFTAEPIIRAGLDVFLDLSALFGVVTARVEATPTIGIGMPITVIDSEFNGVNACFNFDLFVSYIASIGWCDFCVKAEGTERLFTVAQPNEPVPCEVYFPKSSRGSAPLLANARPAVSIDDFGATWVAYETTQGIIVEQQQGPFLVKVHSLDSKPGAMRPEMVWMGEDTALVIWNQTDLTEQEFLEIDGNTDFSMASSRLHLVYSIYDADTDSFGPTQPLTPSGMGGDGGVELAVCPPGQASCGAGRILAVWEHDRAGDLAMHDLEVRWAEFDGLTQTWGPTNAIDPGNVFKQVQPEALYHDGEPMVIWIENPDADNTAYDMNQRHLRYRFPNLAAAQDAPGIPASIASPDAVSQDGEVLIVYTISADPTRFIGSRRSLHSATGTCTGGLCSWTDEERLDARGRSLYVEQPQVVRGEDGRVTAYFRYLANSDVQEDDPVGVRTYTGDIAKLELLAPTLTEPTPLTSDGRVNWGLQAVVNPVNGNVLTALAKGPQLEVDVLRSVGSKAVPRMQDVRGVSGNPDVFLGVDSSAPDFSIVEATTTADRVSPGEIIDVAVRMMNRGGMSSVDDIQVVATWDRPFGAALPAATQTVSLGAAGSMAELTLSVPAPDNSDVDQQRLLYITVDPGAVNGDATAEDSMRRLTIGGLPVPQNLRILSSRDSKLVQIEWNPVEDERVVGYTVYRRNPDGRVLLLGTTETNGFLDLRAVPDRVYDYQVRSHSAKLNESEPTPWMEHYLQELIPRGLLFRDGFEGP